MESYLHFIPEELLTLTLDYLSKYNDIVNYGKFLNVSNINTYRLFEKNSV